MNELTYAKTFAKSVKRRIVDNIDKINGMFFLKNIVNLHWGMYLIVYSRNIIRKEDMKKEEVQN